jgi:hypothetical protein
MSALRLASLLDDDVSDGMPLRPDEYGFDRYAATASGRYRSVEDLATDLVRRRSKYASE